MAKYETAMAEHDIMKEIQRKCSRGNVRLFRANAGTAWQGKNVGIQNGVLMLAGYRRIELMPAGFSDLVGWKSVIVREEHVGQRVAVFCGIEAKGKAGRYRTEQRNFRIAVDTAGGISGIARSVEEAGELLGV